MYNSCMMVFSFCSIHSSNHLLLISLPRSHLPPGHAPLHTLLNIANRSRVVHASPAGVEAGVVHASPAGVEAGVDTSPPNIIDRWISLSKLAWRRRNRCGDTRRILLLCTRPLLSVCASTECRRDLVMKLGSVFFRLMIEGDTQDYDHQGANENNDPEFQDRI